MPTGGCVPESEVLPFCLTTPHNLYPPLAELVARSFLYGATWGLCSHTGQPSPDPVVFFEVV